MASTKKIRGLLVEIGGDTTKLQSALKDVDKKTSGLSKELRGINTLLKFDPSNTILLNQKTRVLSESIEETENRLKALKQAQDQLDASNVDKNSAEYRDLQREIESTNRKLIDLKNSTSNLTKTGEKLEVFGENIKSIGTKVDKVGNQLTTKLTLPVVALGTYATKTAIDFESAFAGVMKTVDATEQEYAELRAGIIAMSKELPATTTEISAIAEAAGQLGIQKDSILSFTKTMIDLGESTNLTANDAATQLARFANITQMSQKDFDKLGSTIVALGNNFATTEAEIVSMGLRLAGAGKQVGMSEAQIMSFATALSSVGIEAEMGGSAFSKVMLKIESAVATNADSLKNWADVSGLSVKEFKDLWEKDASSALSKFINGLSNLESKGQNATVVLEEMELSEVRVRDTLLRTANASNVFNDALNLGNKSWKENTALTEEANKRYETTESQIAMAKNNVNALAISLGKELLPHANNLLKYLNKLVDKFSEMSEEEQETLLKNLALAASIGPTVKTIGTLTKVIGTTTKGIGTLTKALSLVKNGIGSAEGSAANLAKGITALLSPTGIVIASVTTLAAGFYALSKQESEETKKLKELNSTINSQVKSRNELMKTRQQETEVALREVDNTENLYNELKQLVDVNGKVKDGYQERVDFILNSLNSALGTEYQQVDGIISKYDELTSNIDLLIAKKRVEIILEKQRKNYEDAIEKEAEASRSLAEAKAAHAKSQEKVNALQEKYQQLRNKYSSDETFKLSNDYRNIINELALANVAFENTNSTLKEAQSNYNDLYTIINEYGTNSIRSQSDNIEDLNQIIASNTRVVIENGKVKQATINDMIKIQATETAAAEEEYKKRIKSADDAEKTILENTRRSKQQLLNDTISSLKEQTSAVSENSPEVVEAWKSLQVSSTEQYQAALAQLPNDTRTAVEQMTGVAYDQSAGVATAWASLAMASKDEFDSGIAFLPEDTRIKIEEIAKSVNDNGGKVTEKTKKMADDVIKQLEREGESEILGVNITKGLSRGISNQAAKRELESSSIATGQVALLALKNALGERSPSRITRKYGQFYTKGMAIGITDEEKAAVKSAENMSKKVLEAANISESITGMNGIDADINRRITDATKTVFTTPNIQFNVQKMDQQNLDMAFNYINRKFGSQY